MSKVLFVSSWAPPMVGGPRNLYTHLKSFPKDSFSFLTLYQNLTWSKIDPSTWLPCDYEYYDYCGLEDRKSSTLRLDEKLFRFRRLDRGLRLLRRLLVRCLPRALAEKLWSLFEQLSWSIKVVVAGVRHKHWRESRVIVAVSDMGWALIGAYWLSWISGKHLVLYFFDLYADNHLPGVSKRLARWFEPKMMRRASAVVVTNDPTRVYLESKYPVVVGKCCVVHNTTDLPLPEQTREPKSAESPFTITFAGNIYWPQQAALVEFCKIVIDLRSQGFALRFRILAPSCPEDLSSLCQKHPDVLQHSFVEQRSIATTLMNSDALLIAFSSKTPSDEIIRTASPAKLTEYLRIGTPIIYLGPPKTFVGEFLKVHGCGFVVELGEPIQMLSQVASFCRLPEANRRQMTESALQAHDRYFDPARNSSILQKLLFSMLKV